MNNVIQLDDPAWVEQLYQGWRRAPLGEVSIRARCLQAAHSRGRLQTPAFEAWLTMRATLAVARAMGWRQI